MELVVGSVAGAPIDRLDAFESIAAATGATVQAFDARYVLSRRHLERALVLADRMIDRGEAIADERGVEVLLYASGRRQIDDALEMGLKEASHPVAVLVDGGDEATAVAAVREELDLPDDPGAVLGEEARICEFFEVTEAERGTGADLEDLVIERVALLSIDK